MTLIEHGELVRRALEYVQEERCRFPPCLMKRVCASI